MKIKAIINGNDYRKDNHLELKLSHYLSPYLKDLEHTCYKRHAAKIAADAVHKGYDTLIICGGDGTIHEVINSVIGHNIRLGIIPTGTANDFAGHYKIPHNIKACCNIIKQNLTSNVSLIKCNGKYIMSSVGIGLPSKTITYTDQLRQTTFFNYFLPKSIRSRKYYIGLLPALGHFMTDNITAQIISNDSSYITYCKSLIVSNVATLGRSFQVNPDGYTYNDELKMYLIEKSKSPLNFLKAVHATQHGIQSQYEGVKYLSSKSFTIKTNFPVEVFGDGEIIGRSSEIHLEKRDSCLSLIVPAQYADNDSYSINENAIQKHNEYTLTKIAV